MSTGTVIKLGGIGLFSLCLAVLIRWEIQSWNDEPRGEPKLDTKGAVLMWLIYPVMFVIAFWAFWVERG